MESVRQLRQIQALSRFGSFRRAAEHLGISQSTLSEAIKRAEDIYGVSLFERSRSGIVPTAYGEIALEAANRVLGVLDQAKRDIDMLANFQTGHLVVGCNAYLSEAFVGPAIATMMDRYPGLRFTLKVGTWEDLIGPMAEGKIDVIFGLKPDDPVRGVEAIDHRLPAPLVYCRADHPFLSTADPKAFFSENRIRIITSGAPDSLLDAVIAGRSPIWAQKELRELFVLSSEESAVNLAIVRQTDAFCVDHFRNLEAALEAGMISFLPPDRDIAVPDLTATLAVPADKPKSPALLIFNEMLDQQVNQVWDETHARSLR